MKSIPKIITIDGYNVLITDGWGDIPLTDYESGLLGTRWSNILEANLWIDSGEIKKNITTLEKKRIEKILNEL